MNTRLSDTQHRILRFLCHARQRGYLPSPTEIKDAIGLASTLAVRAELDALRDAGFIRRDPTRPSDILLECDGLEAIRSDPAVYVPLLGTIAAGQPISAEENIEQEFWLPRQLVGYGEALFMLRVRGDSMIDAGIRDGDLVVVRHQESASNGEVVAALLGDEATVKRLSLTQGRVVLLPANSAFEPIDVAEPGAGILGKVVTVIRTL
jgi:repressor LexA